MTADGLYDASTALEEVFLLSSLQAGSRASTTRQLDEEGLDLKDGLTIQLSRVQDVSSLLCSIVVGDEASIERAKIVVAIILEELLHLPRHIGLAERVGPEAERDVGEDGLRREDFAYEGVISRDIFAGLEVEVATVGLTFERTLSDEALVVFAISAGVLHIEFALPFDFLLSDIIALVAVDITAAVTVQSQQLLHRQVVEGLVSLRLTGHIDRLEERFARGVEGYIEVVGKGAVYIDILTCIAQCVGLLIATALQIGHEGRIVLHRLVIETELDRALEALATLVLELILDQREELALRSIAEDDGATTSEATRQLAQTTTLKADDILETCGELLQGQDVLVGTILSDLDLLELGTSRDDDLHRAGRIAFVALSGEGEA